MPFLDRNGLKIHYKVWPKPAPDAAPLLFIPGLSASAEAFPELFDVLSAHWHLYVIDPRGAGKSPGGAQRFKLRDVAADCVAMLDQEGIESAHVLGLSMGGMIAQELVLGWPERVDALILCCTTCGRRPGKRPGPTIIAKLVGGITGAGRRGPATAESIADSFGGILFGKNAPRDMKIRFFSRRTGHRAPTKRGVLSQLWAVRSFASFSRLHQVDTPTLVIHGDEDILVPTVNAITLADAIANAELQILPGGHVFFYEYQDQFLQRIRDFLERADTSTNPA